MSSIQRKNACTKKCAACGLHKRENVVFHKIPKNMANQWSKAANKELHPSAVICSDHFRDSDYRVDGKFLVAGAVPTVFDRNIVDDSSQTFVEAKENFDINSNNKPVVETNSKNVLSNPSNDVLSSEDEVCYIYYLDGRQNVCVLETSNRHDSVGTMCSDASESKAVINSMDTEVDQEHLLFNEDFYEAPLVSDSGKDEKSSIGNDTAPMNIFQNQSLEPYVGLNSFHFTTKQAWHTFCNILSEYKGQIYELQDQNNILQTKVNRLKELLNIHVNKF